MSEINENLEVNETVENTPVESVVPEVEGTEETPVIEEPVAVVGDDHRGVGGSKLGPQGLNLCRVILGHLIGVGALVAHGC